MCSLRSEGSGRAARRLAFFVTQQSRLWLVSISKQLLPTSSCFKTLILIFVLKGRGFSRAVTAAKSTPALQFAEKLQF
jgi:hypothetical protein